MVRGRAGSLFRSGKFNANIQSSNMIVLKMPVAAVAANAFQITEIPQRKV
jgi:hypothetical protein